MRYLRQSTASQEIILGPFLDSTDAVTPETGLTIANTDIKIYKAGATASVNKNSGGATHDAGGRYHTTLDATDTDTLGSGDMFVSVAGALPVKVSFTVLAANVFDALIGGGDLLQVDATQISGDSAAADELERWFDGTAGAIGELGILDRGTAQSATSTTMVLRAALALADDSLIGATILQTGGTNAPQAARITDYVGASDTATVAAWPNGTPGGTITYVIVGTTPESAGGGLDAAGVRAAIGLGSANLDTQLSTIDTVVDRIEVDTQDLQSRTPAALVGGRMDASVGAMASGVVTAAAVATGAIDADAIATDAVTEIQSGLATASAVSAVAAQVTTVDAIVDAILEDTGTTLPASIDAVATQTGNIAAIKSKTDQITIDSGHVTASVKRVGTTTLTPAGTGGQGYGG